MAAEGLNLSTHAISMDLLTDAVHYVHTAERAGHVSHPGNAIKFTCPVKEHKEPYQFVADLGFSMLGFSMHAVAP